MKSIFIIMAILIIGSCSNEENKLSGSKEEEQREIDSKFYTIDFEESGSFSSEAGTKNYLSDNQFMDFMYKYMYSRMDRHQFFKNDELELVFPVIANTENGKDIFLNCLTGTKGKKCYYIIWTYADFNNYDKFKDKKKDEQGVYLWDINETTDTLYTNLEEKEIELLFPDFKGKVIDGEIKKIQVNHNYDLKDERFFHDVKLIGFNRFKFKGS